MDKPNNVTWKQWAFVVLGVAIIGAFGMIVAAMAGSNSEPIDISIHVGEPKKEEPYPSTAVVNEPEPTIKSTEISISENPSKIDTQVTGGISKNYSMALDDGVILVGHADKFQNYEGCVAYLIVGPTTLDFSVRSGLWDQWINVPRDLHDGLVKEQSDTLSNRYDCTPVKIIKCDPQCAQEEVN